MSEVIEARNIKLNVDASDWRDSMVKSGQLLVDSDYITKDYIDLTIKCVEENGPYIVIIPGLALSHSRPDVSVNKTGLSFFIAPKKQSDLPSSIESCFKLNFFTNTSIKLSIESHTWLSIKTQLTV